MNIPLNKVATCLIKCRETGFVWRHILSMGLHLFKAKRLPRPSGGSVFLPARFFGSGDFYRVGAKIFQIVKKSLVFSHSPAKQVPQ